MKTEVGTATSARLGCLPVDQGELRLAAWSLEAWLLATAGTRQINRQKTGCWLASQLPVALTWEFSRPPPLSPVVNVPLFRRCRARLRTAWVVLRGEGGAPGVAGPRAAEDLGAMLRRRRTEAMLTQEQVADRAGLSVRTIRDLERGRVHYPRPESLRLLAGVLGLAGDEFEVLGRREYWTQRAAAAQLRPGAEESSVAARGTAAPRSGIVPAQLPADVAGFTGRLALVRKLDALLDSGDANAVTVALLTGTPGVGKTALAVHWAHRVRHLFPDGQLYLSLLGYSAGPPLSPMEALTRLLRGLDVPPDRVPTDVTEAAALFRSLLADTRTLLVFDDARSADQVRPLLPGGSGCLVVLTSRDALRGLLARNGAHHLTLHTLAPDESRTLLTRLLGSERTESETEAIADLARLCGHLPLALRIAAANLAGPGGHTVMAFAERLRNGNRLAALAVPADTDAMVRAAFDLSYEALPVEARRLFRVLSLAPGREVTAAAAAALIGSTPDHINDVLEQLTGAHLVEQPTPGRYAQPDLLRLYAAERSAAEDAEIDRAAGWERLLEHYLDTLDAAARQLYPNTLRLARDTRQTRPEPARFADHSQAAAWIDSELSTLQAAVLAAAETGPLPAAWLLADALRGYFQLQGTVLPWKAIAAAGLRAAETTGDELAQAVSHLSLAGAYARQDRYGDALRHGERALALAGTVRWVDGEVAAHRALGNLRRLCGQADEATDHLERALALADPADRSLCASIVENIGILNHELGRLDEAADHYIHALELLPESRSPMEAAQVLTDLGDVLHSLGRSGEALDRLEEALTLHRELADRGREAYNLRCQAEVHRDAGRLDRALALAETALDLAREIDNLRLQAQAQETVGTVHRAAERCDQALTHLDVALLLATETGNQYVQAQALIGISSVHTSRRDGPLALVAAEAAVDITRRGGYLLLEGQALTALALAELELDRTQSALGHARAAVAAHQASGYLPGQVQAQRALVVIATRAQYNP